MAAKTLYTAVGHFERKTDSRGRSFPIITLSGKEYMTDIQEMIVWTSLNWRIANKKEALTLCLKTVPNADCIIKRTWEDCIDRLLLRGLLVSGDGETEYDALYDLLGTLYIIPASRNFPLRLLSFFKLTLLDQIPFSASRKLLRKDSRTVREKQVMKLAGQAILSTAEIIKCMEKGIRHLPSEESILDGLYDDRNTTSDNISSAVKSSAYSQSVILAVANLYLRQQVIFERI